MFIEVLPKDLPRHLDALSRSGLLRPFYLAGDTGAALQLDHRLSVDLDFFSSNRLDVQIWHASEVPHVTRQQDGVGEKRGSRDDCVGDIQPIGASQGSGNSCKP